MNIVFYLKEGHKFEAHGCSWDDLDRLVSQFNNGHLMRVKGLYANPKELISFVVYNEEDNLKNIIGQILDVEGML